MSKETIQFPLICLSFIGLSKAAKLLLGGLRLLMLGCHDCFVAQFACEMKEKGESNRQVMAK
jgi:hypothetical protein